MPGVVWRSFRRAGSGWEALKKGRENILKDREWLGGPLEGPRVIERPTQTIGRTSWMAGSGQKALPEGWEWSGGPPGRP